MRQAHNNALLAERLGRTELALNSQLRAPPLSVTPMGGHKGAQSGSPAARSVYKTLYQQHNARNWTVPEAAARLMSQVRWRDYFADLLTAIAHCDRLSVSAV